MSNMNTHLLVQTENYTPIRSTFTCLHLLPVALVYPGRIFRPVNSCTIIIVIFLAKIVFNPYVVVFFLHSFPICVVFIYIFIYSNFSFVSLFASLHPGKFLVRVKTWHQR